jgi:CelD/BcsL family acetyltransferase involved in cellulose biosynthesis
MTVAGTEWRADWNVTVPDSQLAFAEALAPAGADVYSLDPLADPRWPELVAGHPRASVYHSRPWLESLRRTYGYRPIAYTTSAPGGALTNAVVFCQIESWLTGRRMVSAPFSDHCDPLVEDGEGFGNLVDGLLGSLWGEGWKYIEVRPRASTAHLPGELQPAARYCYHLLDLSPGITQLYSSLHKDCIQRKIKRADREGLEYQEGRSPELLAIFHRMLAGMRRTHGLPPQPLAWFRNLAECFGQAMQVRVAFHHGRPAASMITLIHRHTMTYKYGCSDPELTNLGGAPWLFWNVIQEAKARGLTELDLGRSDWTNPGLIAFKDRLGAQRTDLTYWRFPPSRGVANTLLRGRGQRLAGKVVLHTPAPLLAFLGRLLYRHVG